MCQTGEAGAAGQVRLHTVGLRQRRLDESASDEPTTYSCKWGKRTVMLGVPGGWKHMRMAKAIWTRSRGPPAPSLGREGSRSPKIRVLWGLVLWDLGSTGIVVW